MELTMKIIEFIFQDFWHFLGSLLILSVVFNGLGGILSINNIIKVIKNKKDTDNANN